MEEISNNYNGPDSRALLEDYGFQVLGYFNGARDNDFVKAALELRAKLRDVAYLVNEIDAAIQERFPGRGNTEIRAAIRMALGRGERAESLADHPKLTSIRPRLGDDLRAIDIVVYFAALKAQHSGGERD